VKTGELNLAGTRIEFARWSGGERRLPILLLHEGLGSVALWKQFPGLLAAATERDVIAWSRQGHGWSDPISSARAPDYMHREAELLPALHAALGIERAHWLGHSDGGSIALIGASRFPDLAVSLILEAPHVFVEELTVASIAAIGAAYPESDMGERMKRYHADPDHIFARWNDIWLDPAFRDWNIEAQLPQVRAPALLIQGIDDEYGTMVQLDRIADVLPAVDRLELAACGHSPHRDCEAAVIEAVRVFLADRD
jgi:pimeloyl-ACP methyl ester carboxylesterase